LRGSLEKLRESNKIVAGAYSNESGVFLGRIVPVLQVFHLSSESLQCCDPLSHSDKTRNHCQQSKASGVSVSSGVCERSR
jgi:hypothetical protein